MGSKVVLDLEADGLNPTKIWCVVTKDIDNGKVTIHTDRDTLESQIQNARLIIAHFGIEYDFPVLSKLWNINFEGIELRDTVVLSKLYHQRADGGHSLETWGERLKFPKGNHTDFSKLSQEMIDYCIQDVELTTRVYEFLMSKMKSQFDKAIWCEHEMAIICREMKENGFKFDYITARNIQDELKDRLSKLDEEILAAFPRRSREVKTFKPRLTKQGIISRNDFRWYDGNDYSVFSPDAELTVFEWEEFNPQSPKQVIERLEPYWKPVDRTDGWIDAKRSRDKEKLEKLDRYGWRINENNLSTLSEDAPPGARLLVERLLVASRLRTLDTWFESYNDADGRIHGNFNSIGTWVHRLSHSEPNMGNIAAEKTIKYNTPHLRNLAIEYGGRMRKLWVAEKGSYLVGCDMEGAHLRLFAHFIDDKDFINALINGDKKLGTDPHSINKRIIGDLCPDRDRAKTFVFTFLNGGAAPKVAQIFNCQRPVATEILERFVSAYPGLKRLRDESFPRDASRGYFIGLDGRIIFNTDERLMMAGYLQNGEAVITKNWFIKCKYEFKKLGLPFKPVAYVHDELVFEVKGDRSVAEEVAKTASRLLIETGQEFNLKCPLGAECKIGSNWLEAH